MSKLQPVHKNLFSGNLKFLWGLWLVLNVVFIIHKGIVTEGEPYKYIYQAKLLLQTGSLESNNFWFYSTEILLIALSIKIKLGFSLVIAIQILLNGIALFKFHQHLLRRFNKRVALTGSLLLLLNIPLQEFNTYLQTESVFYSLSIIFFISLARIKKLTLPNVFPAVLLLLVLCVTRPTGLLFLPAFSIFIFIKLLQNVGRAKAIAFLAIELVVFMLLLNIGLGSGGEFDFMLPFRYEHIICGVPTLITPQAIQVAAEPNSIYGLSYYVYHNLPQFLTLAAKRTISFFGLFRSHYSTVHNILLVAFFGIQYIAAFFSLRWWRKNERSFFAFMLAAIFMVWMSVIFSCDDWHDRFFLSISVLVTWLGLPFWNKLLTGSSSGR